MDLRDPESRTVHPRFDLRVFTAAERARLEVERARALAAGGAEHLCHRLRWSMWAAKEAAFKAARKLHPELPFHPRRFAVDLFEDGRGEVLHEVAGRLELWLEEARDWVHAVATASEGPGDAPRPERPRRALAFLEEWEIWGAQPGRRVRELARRAVAPLLALEPAEVRVVRDGSIPRMIRGSDPLPVDLSLSHHGRVVACAWRGEPG